MPPPAISAYNTKGNDPTPEIKRFSSDSLKAVRNNFHIITLLVSK